MTNPLDEEITAFQTTLEAFKVVRRILDRRTDPVSNTRFYGLTDTEGHQLLEQAEEQLSKLVAFSLFAVFERTLREHLSNSLVAVSTSTTVPPELANSLHGFLQSGTDNWRIDDVIGMFQPPVSPVDVANVKGIRTYRHHVAHGAAPPVAIPPQTVYAQLTDFLTGARLV